MSSTRNSDDDRGQAWASLSRSRRGSAASVRAQGAVRSLDEPGVASAPEEEAVRLSQPSFAGQHGWREFRSHSPSIGNPPRAPQRAATVDLRDGSVVRTLPQTPSAAARNPRSLTLDLPASASSSTLPLAANDGDEDDPFRASGSAHPPTRLFEPHYGHSRVDSHPLSLAPSIATFRSDDDPRHPAADEEDEEVEARSPLQPTGFPPPQPPGSRASRLFHSLAVSPAARRLSPNPGRSPRMRSRSPTPSPTAGDRGAWQELSPAAEEAGDGAHPRAPGLGLGRRGTLSAAAAGLRRISVRVVNVAGADAEEMNEAELAAAEKEKEGQEEGAGRRGSAATLGTLGGEEEVEAGAEARDAGEKDPGEKEVWEKKYGAHEKAYRQLRGKTLGVFGPDNPLRQGCARVLTARWTEPLILVLIILQVVVQTIQAAPNVYEHPRPTKGFFHGWEDWVLFAIFCAYTVEIAGRILVTGLVINPPRPPAPPEPKTDIYGTPTRSPSLVTKISSRLSPLPSPLASPTAHRAPPFPSPSRRSPLPSPSRLSPLPPSPTKSSYPPGSTDITTMDYARFPGAANASSVSLMRDDAAPPPPRINPGPTGVGLGFSAPSATVYPPHSIKAALASSFPAATAAATANSSASSTHSSRTGPSPFTSSTTPYALSIKRQRATYQQAFLRHSWNRIDAVAVVCFWISFALAQTGQEAGENLWFFRALSVLRATRLLAVTAGTQTILQSLKKASPLLVKVGLFVAFAMILFSIIGVQAFRGSYSRNCVWVDPAGVLPNVTADRRCGGYVSALTGLELSYLTSDGQPTAEQPKGFICGAPSVCVESGNPADGAWSFDNVFAALMQVVIVASANTWTSNMYDMMDADFFVSALYFIVALIVLNYWTLNLLVGVITSTFADIRDETKHSAFANTSVVPAAARYDDDKKPHRRLGRTAGVVRKVYEATRLFWPALIVASVAVQADREYNMSASKSRTYEWLELSFTLAFDVEIAIRLFATLPDWRSFFASNANRVDTFLALVTSLIQIPPIFRSAAYAWLTFFQIARFYRVIIAIPRMRRLLVRLGGTFVGLLNMIAFLLLMTFISALVAVQFLRGIPDPESDDTGAMNYFQIYNAFLAQYQVLSSENWTDVLTTVLSSQRGQLQIALSAIFLCGWMIFSFFIIGNLFIALLNENWQLEEEEKRARQLEAFVNRANKQGQTVAAGWLKRWDPYTFVTSRSKRAQKQPEERGEREEVEEIVDRTVTASPEPLSSPDEDEKPPASPPQKHARNASFVDKAKHTLRLQTGLDSVRGFIAPNSPLDPPRGYFHPRDGTTHSREATIQELGRIQDVAQQRQNTIAQYIVEHPGYDKTLFLFSQRSPIRRFCQALVEPAYGTERINGREPIKAWKWAFQLAMFCVIVGSVAVAGVATPLYRRDYFLQHGYVRLTWYNIAEVATGFMFVVEFIVKVVADGFIYSPNAYLLSVWNCIDFFVLATVLTNVVMVLMDGPSNSRFTRALKAFRALRLINLWPTMRQTFYDVLIVGLGRILDASLLAVLYIIPFAVWGQNIFSGLLYFCTDDSAQCVGEYLVAVTDDWSYLAPRVWANPYVWSFDSFRSSLLILFEIVSLEGWTAVLESSMNIVGLDMQPEANASQFSGLFLVLYNLVGATFILTVFISVIIASFTRRSGNSLLTTEQRQWQDLRRYLTRQRPFKRPRRRPTSAFRAWCYERAIHKHGWWSRGVTALYVVNTIVLATQTTTTERAADAYNYIFLGFTLAYLIDVVVRMVGLGSSFWENGWNLYDVAVVGGTVATTVPILVNVQSQTIVQLQKVFLVALIFKLVQRNDELHQLLKTAVASLPALLNIFALWLCLFLVYAIFYLEMFGLTRWESAETRTSNYYTFFNTMILLALQSTGEGWNEYMHNYTTEWPFCTASSNYLFDDCGSSGWAYALFITWNVLSMCTSFLSSSHLFVNLILGVVVESFSFIYQEYGRVTRISREQMRGFKKVWAEFDPERTGYLQPKDVARFFRRLSGIFEVKVYRDEWSIQSLRAGSYRDPGYHLRSPSFHHYLGDRDTLSLQRVDLAKLRDLVSGIDENEVAARRRNYNRVYHEAIHDAEESLKGISFNKMLTLLAHYRLIDDDSALQIDELARRRRKQQIVSLRVDNDRLNSFLRMVVLRRRFLDHLAKKRDQQQQHGAGVPAINITDEGKAAPLSSPTWGAPPPPPSPALQATPPPSPRTPPGSATPLRSVTSGDGRSDVGEEVDLTTPARVSFADEGATRRSSG
ncbi:calcium channel protein [Rhodotorula kratochvilovae]